MKVYLHIGVVKHIRKYTLPIKFHYLRRLIGKAALGKFYFS